MSCCNCCNNTLNLGCFNSCDLTLNTGIVATAITAGTWVLELDFGRRVIYYSVDVADGETVVFNITNLNENYTYQGVLIDPNDNQVSFEVSGIEYDCIQFTTQIGKFDNLINI
jgi:hypothetical protein